MENREFKDLENVIILLRGEYTSVYATASIRV